MILAKISYRKYKELISNIESWPLAYGSAGSVLQDKMYKVYNISYVKVNLHPGNDQVTLFFNSEKDLIWFMLKWS